MPTAFKEAGSRDNRPQTATTGRPRAGSGGGARRCLAVEGLVVQGALTGDHQVRSGQGRSETEQVQLHLHAGAKPRPQCGAGAEAEAAGRAGPGFPGRAERSARSRVVAQGALEDVHLLGGVALGGP